MKNFVYLFGCPVTGEAAVVDPAWDVDALLAEAEGRGWQVKAALITHTHQDHVNGVEELAARTGAGVFVHEAEMDRAPVPPGPGGVLHQGTVLRVGELEVEALHTPGHSPGAVCYRCADSLFTGDTLFVGRTGRMVFAGGSTRQMYESTLLLKALPEDLTIYPGHDYGPTPTSTIGREVRENPFLGCAGLEEFEALAEAWERENG
jgi:glyoxylase-like metal-dependent hydrolase (beta-lactamase superfamily II)